MSQMTVLDVAIGLTFMYVLLSLLVTTLQEWIASLLGLRATNLHAALENLLSDPQLARDTKYRSLLVNFYKHPVIQSLYKRSGAQASDGLVGKARRRLPSYIPSRTFAIALLDVLRSKSASSDPIGVDTLFAHAKNTVDQLPDGELKTTLQLLVSDGVEGAASLSERGEVVSKRVEQWFNDAMGRASGWYKRRMQWVSFVVAFTAAVALNADSLHVADRLWKDAALRALVVASAQNYHSEHAAAPEPADTTSPQATYTQRLADFDHSSLPIGWPLSQDQWPGALAGWLLTALAASMGAAFWFDLLGRALQMRGSGAPVSAVTGELVERGGARPR